MASADRQGREKRRRLAPGQVPDPLRAHGAWVYLLVSILAGALTAGGRGTVLGLVAGSGFVGVFLLAGSLAIAGRRSLRARFALGLLLSLGSLSLALGLGADRSYLLVSLAALPPALAAAWFGSRQGYLSPAALAFGVTVLVVAAPAAASAGGASARSTLAILATLAPFCYWRTWRLARALGPGWTTARFKRRGLIEAVLAVAWAVVSVAAVRLLG